MIRHNTKAHRIRWSFTAILARKVVLKDQKVHLVYLGHVLLDCELKAFDIDNNNKTFQS